MLQVLTISFSMGHRNTPLDTHILRGKTVRLFYKWLNFIQNDASFLQMVQLYFKVGVPPHAHQGKKS